MPKQTYGIRIRRKAGDDWTRGKQFRRANGTDSGWVEWRSEWPTKMASELRLAQYRRNGWSGHVFPITAPQRPVVYPTATHYSPNFTRAELECRGSECNGKEPPREVEKRLTLLAADLELLRHELGDDVLGINSGYRCPVHNKRVGGAAGSRHMVGDAADLAVPSGEQARYFAAAERVPAFKNGGIGVYPGGAVHVDRRGYKARWNSWTPS